MEQGKRQMRQQVFRTIEEYRMIEPGDHVIAGVSGGADSVCMLAILEEYRRICSFELTVVHIEHGIRGGESLEDALFVQRFCSERKIPCHIERIDVRGLSRDRGVSLEEAGRMARYAYFDRYADHLGANRIAVAHNRNDQAETVLMNLSRGSGVRGLGGIPPVRGRVIRPLLGVSREEIEAWMEEQKLPFCTDRTNLEMEYTRNRIRLKILPELERSINREAGKHIAECAEQLQKAEQYLQRQAGLLYEKCAESTSRGILIHLPDFLQAEELMQEYVLRMTVEQRMGGSGLRDFTVGHIKDMRRLAGYPGGRRMDFPGNLQVIRERDCLLFAQRVPEKKSSRAASVELPKDGVYEAGGQRFLVKYGKWTQNTADIPEKKYTKWLACDKIIDNICLRTRKEGDYLVVNREGGRKKLKDYLIDRKIPREERDSVLLLADGSHILWIVGERISEAAKITEKTEDYIMIQKMEDEA